MRNESKAAVAAAGQAPPGGQSILPAGTVIKVIGGPSPVVGVAREDAGRGEGDAHDHRRVELHGADRPQIDPLGEADHLDRLRPSALLKKTGAHEAAGQDEKDRQGQDKRADRRAGRHDEEGPANDRQVAAAPFGDRKLLLRLKLQGIEHQRPRREHDVAKENRAIRQLGGRRRRGQQLKEADQIEMQVVPAADQRQQLVEHQIEEQVQAGDQQPETQGQPFEHEQPQNRDRQPVPRVGRQPRRRPQPDPDRTDADRPVADGRQHRGEQVGDPERGQRTEEQTPGDDLQRGRDRHGRYSSPCSARAGSLGQVTTRR